MFYIFLLLLPVIFFILVIKFKVGYLKFDLGKTINQSYTLVKVFPEFKSAKSNEGVFYYCEDNKCDFEIILN